MSASNTKQNKKQSKKQKVIHTRVPENLDAEIKQRASNLGLSVSNLVRNVLQHSFGLVGNVVADSANIARSARGVMLQERPADSLPLGSTPTLPGTRVQKETVLGWQEAVLTLNAVCDSCNAVLPKASRAAIGISDIPASRHFLCLNCLKEISHDDN